MQMQGIYQKGMTLIELTVVLLILIALAGLAIPYVGGTNRMALCQATDASMQAVKTAIMGGGPNMGFYMDNLGQYPQSEKNKGDYNLTYLFQQGSWPKYNPKTAVGWRGPYLMTGLNVRNGLDSSFSDIYAAPTETTPNATGTVHTLIDGSQSLDAWGRPIVLQVPYYNDTDTPANSGYKLEFSRLVSAGPGSGLKISDADIDSSIQYDSNAGIFQAIQDSNDRNDDRVLYLKTPDPSNNQPCNE